MAGDIGVVYGRDAGLCEDGVVSGSTKVDPGDRVIRWSGNGSSGSGSSSTSASSCADLRGAGGAVPTAPGGGEGAVPAAPDPDRSNSATSSNCQIK